jgi:hypothetical protein
VDAHRYGGRTDCFQQLSTIIGKAQLHVIQATCIQQAAAAVTAPMHLPPAMCCCCCATEHLRSYDMLQAAQQCYQLTSIPITVMVAPHKYVQH